MRFPQLYSCLCSQHSWVVPVFNCLGCCDATGKENSEFFSFFPHMQECYNKYENLWQICTCICKQCYLWHSIQELGIRESYFIALQKPVLPFCDSTFFQFYLTRLLWRLHMVDELKY